MNLTVHQICFGRTAAYVVVARAGRLGRPAADRVCRRAGRSPGSPRR
ncbi:hypothetical protein ACFYXM_15710 [Streptomyces sp. NPDC002476]